MIRWRSPKGRRLQVVHIFADLMLFHDFSVKIFLNTLIARGDKERHIKTGQIQKSRQDAVLQGNHLLGRMNIDQLRIFW